MELGLCLSLGCWAFPKEQLCLSGTSSRLARAVWKGRVLWCCLNAWPGVLQVLPALQRSKVREMERCSGQGPSVSSDTLGFPKEECPVHFSAWFDLGGGGVGWWSWTLETNQLNKLGEAVTLHRSLFAFLHILHLEAHQKWCWAQTTALLHSTATLPRLRGHAAAFPE